MLGKQIFLLLFHDFFFLLHSTFESDFRSATRKHSLQGFLFLKVYILLVHNMMIECYRFTRFFLRSGFYYVMFRIPGQLRILHILDCIRD